MYVCMYVSYVDADDLSLGGPQGSIFLCAVFGTTPSSPIKSFPSKSP